MPLTPRPSDLSTEGDQSPYAFGWNFDLFRNGDPYDSKMTEISGCVTFLILKPGIYKIVEEEVPEWTYLTPTVIDSIEVENDGSYTFTFINFQWFKVTGYKWNDLDGDGIWDGKETPENPEDDEPGINDWIIYLYDGELEVDWIETYTYEDQPGYYEFTIKFGGDYSVREKLPTGWTMICPSLQEGPEEGFDVAFGYDVPVVSGQNVDGKDFGNFKWLAVSGYKYEYVGGFSESFDDLKFDTWLRDDGDESWSLIEDWLYCNPNVQFPRILANPTMSYTDYAFEADAKLLSGPGYALIFRADDHDNFYSFQYDPGWGLRLRLFQFDSFPAGMDVADAVPYPIDNEWHHLKVTVVGDRIRCYIDSTLVFDVTDTIDPVYLEGGVGFRTWGGAQAYFDNVYVLPITNPLEGWEMILKKDGDVYGISTTDSEGHYEFLVKHGGDYSIMETLPAGWRMVRPFYYLPTAPDEQVVGYTFNAISGKNIGCKDFWNWFFRTYITDTSDDRILVDQFRIVFTPDITEDGLFYKISATNPGGFYFNMMYHVWSSSHTVQYDLTQYFVTKGGKPIHAYIWEDSSGIENGQVDWVDLDEDGEPDELSDITSMITYLDDGTITISGVEPCNYVLITIHITFADKGEDGLTYEEAAAYGSNPTPYVLEGWVEGSEEWSVQSALNAILKLREPRSPFVFGIALDETKDDTPVAGITISLYNSKGRCVDSHTTDEYGFYLFDNLKPDTYVLEIEIPLDVLLEGLEETDLVLRITMEVKMSKGDYIQVSIFIDGESTTVEGPPGLDPSMSVVESSGSSGSSSHPKDNSRPFDGPTVGDSGYIAEPLVSNFNLGIPILVVWFASVLSLAYAFDMRKRKKQARLDLEASIWNNSLEWLYEEDLTK
jgi:hypothetical protein